MIKLNHVSFAYKTGEAGEPVQVLHNVNFQAAPGECVVFCGKSGCGKTTMLRLINGLVPHFYAGNLEGSALIGGDVYKRQLLLWLYHYYVSGGCENST